MKVKTMRTDRQLPHTTINSRQTPANMTAKAAAIMISMQVDRHWVPLGIRYLLANWIHTITDYINRGLGLGRINLFN